VTSTPMRIRALLHRRLPRIDRGSSFPLRTEVRDVGTASTLFQGLPEHQFVWMSPGDAVRYAPEGSRAITTTDGAPVAAFEDIGRRLAGVQLHPEAIYSQHGQAVLEHFPYELAVASRPGRWPTPSRSR